MNAIQLISQDLFDKVRSRFSNLEMGDKTGAVTIDPAEARFYDFDFVIEGTNLGRVSISLGDPGILKVYYSQGITENQDDPVKTEWYKFLKEMRIFAMRRLLRFDTRDIAKTNLDKNDFQHLAATQPTKGQDMTQMNESRWSPKSSKKTSRATSGRTEVIVRHSNDFQETYAGARSQPKHIKSIFIQNADGERFKYPFIHTAGAFAMAQHVDHGGVPHDPAGKAIIKMSEEIAQLGEFHKKVRNATLHDDATGITERALGRMNELKAQVAALGKRHHYESWINEFNSTSNEGDMMLDDVTMEQYKQKFTQTSFQEELSAYFPLLHRIMSETNTVDLEDYVSESDDTCPDCGKHHDGACPEDDGKITKEGVDTFEEWAEAVEQGKLTNDQIAQLKQSLGELPQGAEGPELELGPQGSTAIQFFQGLGLDDSDLADKLKDIANIDPETDALEVFKIWANNDYPELAVALGMSDTGEAEPTPPEADVEQPAAENEEMSGPANKTMATREGVVKEVAKLVKSRFNKDNPEVGPFNGKENIALDVKKKCAEMFGDQVGEQAESLALEFMEKLSEKWEQEHGQVANGSGDDGLARLKELLGNVKTKVEGIGDQGPVDKNIMPAYEGVGNFAKAMDTLRGWHQVDSDDSDIEVFNYDDREGGYYADGIVRHNLKTGEITVDFEDKFGEYGGDVKGTFNSIGDAMKALRNSFIARRGGGKAHNYDSLGGRDLAGPDDLYKTDRAGKKGTLTKSRMDQMKMSSQSHMRGGPNSPLPEMVDILRLSGYKKIIGKIKS